MNGAAFETQGNGITQSAARDRTVLVLGYIMNLEFLKFWMRMVEANLNTY